MTRPVNVFGKPLAYDIGVGSDGPSDEIKEGDDLSDATLKTGTRKLMQETQGNGDRGKETKNTYPVTSDDVVKIKLMTAEGNTPELTPSENGYVKKNSQEQRRLDSYSKSALSDNAVKGAPLPKSLKKGKSANGTIDGNQYVDSKESVSEYANPLIKSNRFNPDSKLVENSIKYRVNPGKPNETLGSHTEYLNSKNGKSLSDGDMANIAPMLSLRSTRELNSTSSDGYGKDGPDGAGASASAILPGITQVALERVAVDDLTAASVLQSLIDGKADPVDMSGNGKRRVTNMDQSYGQLNNVLEPFNGLLPVGMIATAAALAISLNVALKGILALFLVLTTASNNKSRIKDSIGKYMLGQSQYSEGFDGEFKFLPPQLPAKLFGLLETKNPYGSAVEEGIKLFFGGRIDKSAQKILESPGFYANFCRTIVRSAADFAREFGQIGTGNPIQVAENIVNIVSIIKNSKVVAVLNVFAQMGDNSLNLAQQIEKNPDVINKTTGMISTVDSMEDEPGSLKSRTKGSLRMAWSHSNVPSAILFSQNYSRSAKYSSTKSKDTNGKSNVPLSVYSSKSAKVRISKDDVKKMEEALDAEYVPFYFHDLRTNEIVSMQAFLYSLSDSFDASYTSESAYGRVEPIKTWSGTTRKIGLSFACVPTNQLDFDEMWLKINKLITFVYPQWSQGTILTKDGESFIQPFSQIPSATPVIRLRVGDVIRSNYSDMSLARMFGLGSDAFKLNGTSDVDKVDEVVLGFIQDTINRRLTSDEKILASGDEFDILPGSYESTNSGGVGDAILGAVTSIASTVGIDTPTQVKSIAKVPYNLPIIIKEDLGTEVLFQFEDGNNVVGLNSELMFVASKSNLYPSQKTIRKIVSEFTQESDVVDNSIFSDEAIRKFFDENSNSIVKSFRQNQGKGLACVVENISFEWVDSDSVTWEIDRPGFVAPKFCKVTMSISPIHDIAPGIDSDGTNRAPVYPVGSFSNALGGHSLNEGYVSQFRKNRTKKLI